MGNFLKYLINQIVKISKQIRFMSVILLFFGWALHFILKIDISIGIVCMTNHTALKLIQDNKNTSSLLLSSSSNHSNISFAKTDQCAASIQSHRDDGPFVWEKKIQGVILSSYFYGYILTQIPGGYLSFRFGGRNLIIMSMLLGSCITLLMPIAAKWSYKALIACHFLRGFVQGAFWPSLTTFWAYWAPVEERSRLIGLSQSGSRFGNIFALMVGGILCVHGYAGGWPSIFYTFGIFGIVWSILFYILVSNTPETHRFISEKEKNYIIEKTKETIETKKYCESRVPWKSIFTSKACYALFIGHFCHNWGLYLFMTQIPTYLREVLKFDLSANGFISAIPYISSCVSINLSCFIFDALLNRGNISKKTLRRIFIGLGMIVPAFIIIGLSFIDCSNIVLGVVVLTIGIAFDSIIAGPVIGPNLNDISGPYAGILCGISNTIASCSGLISPYVANALTPHQTQKEWQIVFIICAVLLFVGGTIYIVLLEVESEPWSIIEKPEETKEENLNEKL